MPYRDTTVGLAVLDNRGIFKEEWWRWVGMAALLGYAIVFNILVLLAQTYLGRESLAFCMLLESTMLQLPCCREGISWVHGLKAL